MVVPRNRLPIEQIERSKPPFSVVGRKVGAWRMGKIGLARVKYVWMHIFYKFVGESVLRDNSNARGCCDAHQKISRRKWFLRPLRIKSTREALPVSLIDFRTRYASIPWAGGT